ncbi:MAG TPA: GTP-binding protein [Gemmatimonadaceae bacterium]|nr:GTP-binding protein [Gemmatimonadaceae bacterium]
MTNTATEERMSIVIVGHVDHGKSTIIGRLLADSHSLPDGKLEQVKELCARTAKPFEYAFLLDALRDERAQGITIDSARVFFRTLRREYIVIDAPGHIEFLKNMITGASRAEAALLVIDAQEGVQENSRRHGYMLAMLGIKQCVVLINKMDLVGYAQAEYDKLVASLGDFLAQVNITPACFIPVSGRDGDNLADASMHMPWYRGPTVLQALDMFEPEAQPVGLAFRLRVQDVYKFTGQGDDRRIIAGTIDSGQVAVGDRLVFLPSGKRSRVKSIEAFNRPPQEQASAGWATGVTLTEQIYVSRGELAVRESDPLPHVTTRLRVSLFWLGQRPLEMRKEYALKMGSARIPMRVEAVDRVIDASTLAARPNATRVERHDVADCVLKIGKAVAFDLASDLPVTSRFVIVDEYDIRGGGIVREALPDQQGWVREKVLVRNSKWERGSIPAERRAERYNQRAMLLLITGDKETERKVLAKELEGRLFAQGKVVYFLGIGSVLYGVDADLGRQRENRLEHMRRLAEVANIMLDAGMILIVTAAELTSEDLDVICTAVEPERIETIWVGDRMTTDLECNLYVSDAEGSSESLDRIETRLKDLGVVFRPW